MFHARSIFVLTALCFALAHADDEVKFKPKVFDTDKRLESRPYTASAYSPSGKTPGTSSSFKSDNCVKATSFVSSTSAFSGKTVEASPAKAGNLRAERADHRSHHRNGRKSISEIKPFKAARTLTHTVYKPQPATNEKNPMLPPLLGIRINQ
jgi:hypothetical protein